MPKKIKRIFTLLVSTIVAALFSQYVMGQWNNPHVINPSNKNIFYSSFIEPPKTLDPAKSYSSNEAIFIAQIYEPLLQYAYLKRPYTLVPLTAIMLPTVTFYNQQGEKLPDASNPGAIAYTIYDISIKPGILYQPHPAFAKDHDGHYVYHHLTARDLSSIHTLEDFKKTGARELTADDYEYEIKRLASPTINSPILGVMSKYIVGLNEYANQLQKYYEALITKSGVHSFFDLRQYPLEGVKVIDRYHLQIKIKGIYPQFKFWLAMPVFSPIPWEADLFYSQPGMADRTITLDWYPVGTGPYMMTQDNPNRKIVLERNPNFHGETFPKYGEESDEQAGYLNYAGLPIPFIDRIDFDLEKESIPRWNKFLQGYYDRSAIAPDNFDQAIKIDAQGHAQLTESMKKKGIRLQTVVAPSVYFTGFNMLDDVVGGYDIAHRKLRQAIAIALDDQEFISIFLNGRGVPAQGPIPPGIFGYQKQNINPVVYEWHDGVIKRKDISVAKKLLADAGYPNGIDPKTSKALILNYDVAITGGPDEQSRLNWTRKQFTKLGIQLNIRATDYNRFQEKVRVGNAQIFSWGWIADYPDPENFLFLFYGPNGKVKFGGENAVNYLNPTIDGLYEAIRDMPNGPERQKKINQFLNIIRIDSPWVFDFHPIDFTLSHVWNSPTKPTAIAYNTFKYQKINPDLRAELQEKWNEPILWPLWIIVALLIAIAVPLILIYQHRERNSTVRRVKD